MADDPVGSALERAAVALQRTMRKPDHVIGLDVCWRSIADDSPQGVGGQVWVAYPNPAHPDGWTLRIQWTPIVPELAVEPVYWRSVAPVDAPFQEYAEGGRMKIQTTIRLTDDRGSVIQDHTLELEEHEVVPEAVLLGQRVFLRSGGRHLSQREGQFRVYHELTRLLVLPG